MDNSAPLRESPPYLCGVAYPRAVWRLPADAEQRRAWTACLKVTAAVLALAVAFPLFLISGKSAIEATVEMERLAARLEHATSVDPQTSREIKQLISKPWYDCNQIACDAQLQLRNAAVHIRLQNRLIAKASQPVREAEAVAPRSDH
jgi:hypothetical protein